jgi:hypothetical protein
MEHVRNGESYIKGNFPNSNMAIESVILQGTEQVAWWGEGGDACKYLVRKYSQKSLFIACIKCIKAVHDGDVLSVYLHVTSPKPLTQI